MKRSPDGGVEGPAGGREAVLGGQERARTAETLGQVPRADASPFVPHPGGEEVRGSLADRCRVRRGHHGQEAVREFVDAMSRLGAGPVDRNVLRFARAGQPQLPRSWW